jgi:hypothetical protein
MSDERILFRGARVLPHWPDRIREAQMETTCVVGGVELPRVRYGNEAEDWGANDHPCHDCSAIKGEFHVPGCDVERCPTCGAQLFGCDCD